MADGHLGGTRYGPLGIVLSTAASKVSGEYLTSGKVVALLIMLAVLAIAWRITRERGASPPVAVAAVGAIAATFTAVFAATTIYGDALAVALQLAAVGVVARGAGRREAATAGALAGLAVTAKLTGVWGAATVALWLLPQSRRGALPAFLAAAAATVGMVFGLAALASSGRIVDNLLGLGGSDSNLLAGLGDVPSKAWDALIHNAQATVVLAPFALAAVLAATARRRLDIVELALLVAVPLTWVVLADVGTGFNHLLDLSVLVPLVVAVAHARARSVRRSSPPCWSARSRPWHICVMTRGRPHRSPYTAERPIACARRRWPAPLACMCRGQKEKGQNRAGPARRLAAAPSDRQRQAIL